MKRCIICGNVGADDSTTCEVCGNPYLEVEEGEFAPVDSETVPDFGEVPEERAEEASEAGNEQELSVEFEEPAPESLPMEPDQKETQRDSSPAAEQAAVEEGGEDVGQESQPGAVPHLYGQEDQARPGRARSTAARRSMAAAGQRQTGRGVYGQEGRETSGGNPSGGYAESMAAQGSYRQEIPGRSAAGQRRQGPAQAASRPGMQKAGPSGTADSRQPGAQKAGPSGTGDSRQPGAQAGPAALRQPSRPPYGPNGQAGNPQGRPMNGPGVPAGRPAGYPPSGMGRLLGASVKETRIREAARSALRSPVLLLVALLNTVCLASSVAAIFLEELNYSQMVRLLSEIELPAQYAGYMDDLMKLTATLDTGAVALNLVLQLPNLLLCLGLWMILFAGRSKKEEVPSGGFLLGKIYVIIGLVKNSLIMLACLVVAVAFTVSAWASGVQNMKIAAVAFLVMMVVITMLVVMYHFCYLSTFKAVRFHANGKENCGRASAYVALMYIVMSLFGIVSLLSGIVNSEITGILGGVSRLGWMLLFAVWIFMYRGRLNEVLE